MDVPPQHIELLASVRGTATEGSPAKSVRVAFFSDSLPERNGTGAYYHDLAGQLAPEVEALAMFQPVCRGRTPLLSLPMPGDPVQRLVTPNVFRIARGYKKLRPHVVIAITPGPFGLLGLLHAKRSGAQFISAFHTDFEQLARIYWNAVSRTVVNGYLRTANRILCKNSRTVLINNSQLESDVNSLGGQGVEVMGTPLQPAFLNTPIKPPPAKVRDLLRRTSGCGEKCRSHPRGGSQFSRDRVRHWRRRPPAPLAGSIG